jgi:endo-1,4-beta-xylanase
MLRFAVAGVLGAAALSWVGPPAVQAISPDTTGSDRVSAARSTPRQTDLPLRVLAARNGLRIGTAVDADALANDEVYRTWLKRDFSAVTPENAMKWDALEPVRGQYNWGPADQIVDAALKNGQKVHGHTLLWHNQLPAWLTQGVTDGSITDDEFRTLVQRHITDVVRHFRGRIWQWDVVNEMIADGSNPGLRESLLLQHLGPDYVADALRWARQADPRVELWLNDYGADRINTKSDAYYGLASQLVADGVPLDGVGFQGHVAEGSGFPITAVDNLQRFGELGLTTGFTEVDVRYQLPGNNHKTAAQVGAFTTLLQACLLSPSCEMFTLWGFTDRYSWIPGWFTDPPEGEATPLDKDYQPKAAYRALQQTLALAG